MPAGSGSGSGSGSISSSAESAGFGPRVFGDMEIVGAVTDRRMGVSSGSEVGVVSISATSSYIHRTVAACAASSPSSLSEISLHRQRKIIGQRLCRLRSFGGVRPARGVDGSVSERSRQWPWPGLITASRSSSVQDFVWLRSSRRHSAFQSRSVK